MNHQYFLPEQTSETSPTSEEENHQERTHPATDHSPVLTQYLLMDHPSSHHPYNGYYHIFPRHQRHPLLLSLGF